MATVSTAAGTLYLTYGFSEALDPERVRVKFEMSIVVPGEATMWPALLLRSMCRYMLGSKRPLEVGQSMPFPAPLTRFFAPLQERALIIAIPADHDLFETLGRAADGPNVKWKFG